MNTFDAIYQRRAIKEYDPQHKLSAKEEAKLFEAAIQSPTSFNIQHWRFVVVRDPGLRKKIRTEFGNDQAQMTDASLLIIMTADTKAWQKNRNAIGRMLRKRYAICWSIGWDLSTKDGNGCRGTKPNDPSAWPCRP